jgi:hypothetical protein
MTRSVMAALLCCCVLAPSALAAPPQRGPRFVFKQGDVLTYDVHISMKGTSSSGGQAAGYASLADGNLMLTVRSLRADGTAEIQLTATGKGKMTVGGESTALDEEPATPLIAVVRPNGAIVEVRDTKGKKTSLFESMENLFAAGTQIQMLLIGNYALFGLQLPAKLPAVGGQWTGTYKAEQGSSKSLNLEDMKIELKSVPVTFVYKGPGKYEGRPCFVFTGEPKIYESAGAKFGIPTAFYFDDNAGRLLALEQHAKNVGKDRATVDETVKLVPSGKPAQGQ